MAIKNNDYNLVNVAFVGYGYIAQYWEKAISQDSRINIAGIYDNGIAGSKITGYKMYSCISIPANRTFMVRPPGILFLLSTVAINSDINLFLHITPG